MKPLFIIILITLFSRFIVYPQGIDGNKINIIDKTGRKQGYWIKYKTDTVIKNIYRIGYQQKFIDTSIYHHVLYTGYYYNHRKDSIWLIYDSLQSIIADTLQYGVILYKAHFKNDSLNGLLITFYSNGNKKSEIEFKNNHADGLIKCYFENGKLKYLGNLVYGTDFFNGSEYSINGLKIRDRKFNCSLILNEWTNINDLLLRLSK